MTKFQEAIGTYNAFMVEKLNDNNVNENVLVALAQMLGNNIYDADASLVACSDKAELARVKELFLVNELGLENSPKLDEAIKAVCTKMGSSNRKKFRVVFYYLLLQQFGLEGKFGGAPAPVKAAKTVKTAAKTTAKAVETPVKAEKTATKAVKAPATKATKAVAEVVAKPTATTTTVKKVTATPKAVAVNLSFDETVKFFENFIVNEIKYPFYNYDVMVKLAESTGTVNEYGNLSVVDIQAEGETQRIKANFLQGRLGLEATAELDDAIELVNTRIGNLPKYRVPFYYLLTKHLGREWAILQNVEANLY